MTGTVSQFEPATPDEAASARREAARAGARVGIVGGGTHAPAADRVDALLATRGMRRIHEYAPEDQTITVETGITLAELERELTAQGQRLVVEAAEPERATLGGTIAANVFGPRRLCYGTLKDLILGVTLVRVDGTQAHAGGKVVKNVAGFDLSKLMVGSFGTLALVTVVTLRVHPLPEATRAFRAHGLSPEGVWQLVTAIRTCRLEPAGVLAFRAPGDALYDVDVLVEGFAAGVAGKVAAFAKLAADERWRTSELDPGAVREADAAVRRTGTLRVRAAMPAADFAAVEQRVVAPILHELDAPATVAYPALGVAFVAGTPRDAARASAAFDEARAYAERRSGSLVVETVPAADAARFERWGTPPPSFPIMKILKSRFDPDGRLNPGTFIGGL
ncbi:MAG: FAD-binding oxidoreductase [Vulcanimicrobiaceae bacterium]